MKNGYVGNMRLSPSHGNFRINKGRPRGLFRAQAGPRQKGRPLSPFTCEIRMLNSDTSPWEDFSNNTYLHAKYQSRQFIRKITFTDSTEDYTATTITNVFSHLIDVVRDGEWRPLVKTAIVTVMRTVLLMCRLGTTSCIVTNQCTLVNPKPSR